MQSVSSRIWTGVAVSISLDDDYYTTGTSTKFPLWYYGLFFKIRKLCSNPKIFSVSIIGWLILKPVVATF